MSCLMVGSSRSGFCGALASLSAYLRFAAVCNVAFPPLQHHRPMPLDSVRSEDVGSTCRNECRCPRGFTMQV